MTQDQPDSTTPAGGGPTSPPPPPPTAEVPPVQPTTPALVAEWERTYSMFMHLTLLAYHFVPVPVIGALVMWLIKREESPFVDDHGKEAVNFQISLVLYALVGVPLLFVCGIGFVVFAAVWVLGIVGMILGAIAANKGQYFRYPACLRFVK